MKPRSPRRTSCLIIFAVFAILVVPALAEPFAVPIITFVSPVSANPGGAAFTLTVNGANFFGTSVVYWSGTALATTYVNSDQLTALVPATLTASSGTGWITVATSPCGAGCKTISPSSNVFYFPVIPATSGYTAVPLTATVGNTPLKLATADLNGDGNLDLAVANYSDSTMSILLGNGDGTFQTQQTYTTLHSPVGIAVGDLNGDGIPDLVVGNDSTSGGLNIFLGNGSGGFTAGTSLTGGVCLLEPALADLNQDGNLDIVVGDYGTGDCGSGNSNSNTIYVYLGNGDGTFGPPTTVTGSNAVWGMVVADFNGDGILDLAAADYGNSTVDIYLGNGDGTFGTVAQITANSEITQLKAADFNGDGNVDLLASSEYSGSGFSIFYGNGDGTFQPPITAAGAGDEFSTGETGDMNGDQILDIVGNTFSTSYLWLGAPVNTFQSPLTVGTVGINYGIVLANFATAGGLNIATISNASNEIVVFVPTVVISPPSQNFGAVNVGSSAQQVFTVTNDTSSTVTISSITFTGANPTDFAQNNTCSSPLASAATCTITVTFTPADMGSFSATLNVADNAPASPQTASLTGTGVAAPIVSLSPASLAFGNVNLGATSAAQPVVLTNTGNAALVITSIGFTGTNSADFAETDNCPGTLNPSAQCTLMVTFTPSLVGAESASLQFTDNAADSPETVSLTGTGVSSFPVVRLSPTSLAFGNVTIDTTSPSQPVVLTNTGTAPLTIVSIGITGANSGDFAQTNNCPGSLNPSSQCTVTVTFTPSLTSAESASLQFTDNAGDSPETVALSGTGAVAPGYSIAANPTSLTIQQGQAGTTTLTISPVGGITGTVNFSCTGLPAKANCAFSPAQATLSGNNEPVTVTLTVNTTGSNGVLSQIRKPSLPWTSIRALAVFAFPSAFLLLTVPGRIKASKRSKRYLYLALLLLIGVFTVFGMVACGGGSSQATPPGQYSVSVVAAASGSGNQTAVVSITIAQ
ncbi:MAG: choice-of-anchor D domain-containing protein [Terriglobales bacterium]